MLHFFNIIVGFSCLLSKCKHCYTFNMVRCLCSSVNIYSAMSRTRRNNYQSEPNSVDTTQIANRPHTTRNKQKWPPPTKRPTLRIVLSMPTVVRSRQQEWVMVYHHPLLWGLCGVIILHAVRRHICNPPQPMLGRKQLPSPWTKPPIDTVGRIQRHDTYVASSHHPS